MYGKAFSDSEAYIIAINYTAELEEGEITIFVIILGINMLKVSKINQNFYAIISKLFKISIFICMGKLLVTLKAYIIAINYTAELEEGESTIFVIILGINMLKVSKINRNFYAIISKLFKISIFICMGKLLVTPKAYIIAINYTAELEEGEITIFVIILGINMLKVSKINRNLYAIISKLFKIYIFICMGKHL